MERLLTRLAEKLATRPGRRLVPARGRGVMDPRRSFRAALATDGEFLRFARRARAIEVPRLVALCDTSGSMDAHTRFLLAFLLALKKTARRTEIFVFNTSLTRLTPWLAPDVARSRRSPAVEAVGRRPSAASAGLPGGSDEGAGPYRLRSLGGGDPNSRPRDARVPPAPGVHSS
jgi:uncharacterized protein with von Willebrand factor type A (vWA) domain